MVQKQQALPVLQRRNWCALSSELLSNCFVAEQHLVPNFALRQASEEYLKQQPRLRYLQKIELEHKSLAVAIKLREEEIAHVMQQTTPGNPAAGAAAAGPAAGAASAGAVAGAHLQFSAKRSPEEVKALLQMVELDEYLPLLLDNGCASRSA